MKTETYTLPVYWADYLINRETKNTFEQEIIECNQFLEKQGLEAIDCVGCSEESLFSWGNDANRYGGDCLEYTFIRAGV